MRSSMWYEILDIAWCILVMCVAISTNIIRYLVQEQASCILLGLVLCLAGCGLPIIRTGTYESLYPVEQVITHPLTHPTQAKMGNG